MTDIIPKNFVSTQEMTFFMYQKRIFRVLLSHTVIVFLTFFLQLPALTFLGLVASSFGAPQFPSMGSLNGLNSLISNFNRQNYPNQYQSSQFEQAFNGPYQPFQIGRTANDPNQAVPVLSGENAPLGLTVDFDSTFGKK